MEGARDPSRDTLCMCHTSLTECTYPNCSNGPSDDDGSRRPERQLTMETFVVALIIVVVAVSPLLVVRGD